MKNNAFAIAALILAVAMAFLAGRNTATPGLSAQGVDTTQEPTLPPTGPVVLENETANKEVLMYSEGSGGSQSANGILAVTGSYGVGTSVLYVIDTESKQLAVYEARGGSRSMRRLTLVGARRIDLDLQLRGYNDESEYQYGALEKMFSSRKQPGGGRSTPGGIDATGNRR